MVSRHWSVGSGQLSVCQLSVVRVIQGRASLPMHPPSVSDSSRGGAR